MFEFQSGLTFQNKGIDVLAVGELLIDFISQDYDDTSDHAVYHTCFGGSPTNIAMNLINLGARSQIVAAVDQDRLGSYLI